MTTHFAQLVEDGAQVEVRSFTPAELDIITDALRIANAHYESLGEMCNPKYAAPGLREQCYKQASEAGELQLKIEAAR